jgi:hypothetical protein
VDSRAVKKMIFEFAGGPLDGKQVIGESTKDKEARRYYMLTNHGQVGLRFHTASDYAIDMLADEQLKEEKPHHFQQHTYEVVDRIKNSGVLVVLVQYVEQEPGEKCRQAE